MNAALTKNHARGSSSRPILTRLLRSRVSWATSPIAAAKPRISVNISKVDWPPVRSGRKPEPTDTYCGGNGVIGTLFSTIWVSPRKVSMPARVTMNAGMPT